MSLKGKVAIVTGGNSGIGAAIALELARQGANIVIDYVVHPEATEELEKQIIALGDQAIGVQADVSKVADLQMLIDSAVKAFGRVDIMVNNAGVETRTSILDTTEDQYNRVMDINLKSAFFGTQLAAKLIAEAWDAAGLYQGGSFVGDAWKEWNGQFRDDGRRFVKSENGAVGALAERLTGSPAVYGPSGRAPETSINFLTVHDGFTLTDLVSYNAKHNEANGEENRDGADDNRSWNCGVEGPTADPAVEALRNRQVKNLFTLLLTATGAPLILMGDEVRRTQQGNNNAYCQDSDISWFDWALAEKHADVRRFVKELIAARLSQLQDRSDDDTLLERLRETRVEFHGVALGPADEGEMSHSLAISRESADGTLRLYLMINPYWEPLTFVLPPTPDADAWSWRRWIDTSCPPPDDICSWTTAPMVQDTVYRVGPRSVVALVATANKLVADSPS